LISLSVMATPSEAPLGGDTSSFKFDKSSGNPSKKTLRSRIGSAASASMQQGDDTLSNSPNTVEDNDKKDKDVEMEKATADAVCPICLCAASESPEETFSRLSCGHEFHRACLNVWLEKHVTCPICRQLVTNKQTVSFIGHQVVRLTKRETLTQRAFRYARFVGAFDNAQEATLEFSKDNITLTQLYSKNWCFGQRRVSKNLMCGPPLENLTQFSVLNDILVLCRKVQNKKATFELFAMRFSSIANCCATFDALRGVLPSRLTQ